MTLAVEAHTKAIAEIQRVANGETVKVLEALLEKARCGEVAGLAVVAMDGPRRCRFYLTGQAVAHPIHTAGALVQLKHLLMAEVVDT